MAVRGGDRELDRVVRARVADACGALGDHGIVGQAGMHQAFAAEMLDRDDGGVKDGGVAARATRAPIASIRGPVYICNCELFAYLSSGI